MPSLNLRNVLRRNPDRPSLRERAAALKTAAAKVIRRPKPENAGSAEPAETWDFLDTILLSLVREVSAIEASQNETLAAVGAADAHECPDWVRLEQNRKAVLSRIISTRARTVDGVKAKASLLDLCSIKSFQQPFDDLSRSIEADAARLGAMSSSAACATDPHVALLPALRQAYAWDRASRPISSNAANNSFEEEASAAVYHHCWDTAGHIIALPAPKTLAGLGALALALSVKAEDAIGSAGYEEERRHAAAIRAMMSIAGVEPLPDWCGFGDEGVADPFSNSRYSAMLDRMGKGSLPAWALAGKSAPDAEEIATSGEALPADLPKAVSPAAGLDLSGYSILQLCALFDVYEQGENQFHVAAWWPKLGEEGRDLVVDEGDRCLALKTAVEVELLRRAPENEEYADDRGQRLMRCKAGRMDWDATAQLASTLRDEVAAFDGKH